MKKRVKAGGQTLQQPCGIWLCHADEALKGQSSCLWAPDTSWGDMVVCMHTVMATLQG